MYTTAEYFSALSIMKHYREYKKRKIISINEVIRDTDVISHGKKTQTQALNANISNKLEEEKRNEKKWKE